ncbi:hypothetical protein Dda_8906 [Drechslerella dactyloides]|uniref:Uncharacterized protein n=1 Tax=Drechslerella dactyloides TaxID=74499 RepID=A0AAD6NER4_DREDA|nr:hypothetical protein Dda_8906 [Drechslerella dactyloides]
MLSNISNALYDAVVTVAVRQHQNELKQAQPKPQAASAASMTSSHEKSTQNVRTDDNATLAGSRKSTSSSLEEKGRT